MKMEAEILGLQPGMPQPQRLEEAAFFPLSAHREQRPADIVFQTSSLLSIVLSHSVCDNLLQQLQKINITRRTRHREVKELSRGHTASAWQSCPLRRQASLTSCR